MRALVDKKKVAYNKWLSTRTDEDLSQYRGTRKDVQKVTTKAKTKLGKEVGRR